MEAWKHTNIGGTSSVIRVLRMDHEARKSPVTPATSICRGRAVALVLFSSWSWRTALMGMSKTRLELEVSSWLITCSISEQIPKTNRMFFRWELTPHSPSLQETLASHSTRGLRSVYSPWLIDRLMQHPGADSFPVHLATRHEASTFARVRLQADQP
jgi:hypothetical protein